MKKLKNIVAVIIAILVLTVVCDFLGGMTKVQAAYTDNELYAQMKVEDISMKAGDLALDNLVINDNNSSFQVDLKINVPEEWYVSLVEIGWTNLESDFYLVEYASQSYTSEDQPENGIYSLEMKLHKYMKPAKYRLDSITVEFCDMENEQRWYILDGTVFEYEEGKYTEKTNLIEWSAFDYNWDDFMYNTTPYNGDLDFTIKSVSGVDAKVPIVTKIEMGSSEVLSGNLPTELKVTVKEEGSGIRNIVVTTATIDYFMEIFSYSVDNPEECKGTKTITFKSTEEDLEFRESGKYYIESIYLEDYAGNLIMFEADRANAPLVGNEYIQNADGSEKRVEHTVENVKYTVCNKHSYLSSTTKATINKDGYRCWRCQYCNKIEAGSKETIHKIDSVKLAKIAYVYNGKVNKPKVTVKDAKGNIIDPGDYAVIYPSGCKNVGQYKVKITFKNDYKGTVYRTYTIKPKGTNIASLSKGSKKFTVKWKKQTTQTTGYQIRYSTNSEFKTYKNKSISNKNTSSATIKNLKANKKYYVKIRTYKKVKVNGEYTNIYSAWSPVKTVKTK